MRYVTPYLSRKAIDLANYFVSLCYFLIILAVSLAVLFLFRGAIVFQFILLSIIVFFLYPESRVTYINCFKK